MSDAGGPIWYHKPLRGPIRQWFVAGIALTASASLHYNIIERLPEVSLGRMTGVASYVRVRPVILKDVRLDPQTTIDRPETFRAEDATQTENVMRDVDVSVDAVDPFIPVPASAVSGVLDAHQRASLKPVPTADRGAWDPAQDILKIEHRRVVDGVHVAPRIFTLDVPRTLDIPEFQMPDHMLDDFVLGKAPRLSRQVDSLVASQWRPPNASGSPLIPKPSFTSMEDADERSPIVEEVATILAPELDVSSYEPVEQLLELNVSTFHPDDEPANTYFQIEIVRKRGTRLPVLGRDVIIMQDCSESMTRRKLNSCKDGLYDLLEYLNPEDRFEIFSFRDRIERCFGYFAAANARSKAKANFFIDSMKARGMTDVYASLRELMSMPRDPTRPLISILVTDARPTTGLIDSSEIIEAFTRDNQGEVSVFGLGGGKRVNRFLLDLLSYRNRGDSRVENDRKRIPEAMREMAREIQRPVLMKLRQRFTGLDESELFPKTLTHLYEDRPLVIFGRFQGVAPRTGFQVVGICGEGEKDMVFTLDWSRASIGGEQIRTQWAWHQIYHLIGEYIETQQKDILRRLHGVADRYGLFVPYGREVIYR